MPSRIQKLKSIIEDESTKYGRFFDLSIQFLIVLSLVCFSIETLPDISESSREILRIIEAVTVTIFTAEYLLRIIVSDNKLKYVFSFYGVVDILAILPFYISTGVDLRAIRAFRIFRLLRSFKLLRYSNAMDRFGAAIKLAKEELILYMSMTLVLLYLSAAGIYYFENAAQPEAFSSIFTSMWWAVATMTTVGYGDVYPITAGGRVFTFLVLMIGLGVVAVPTGLIASALSKVRESESES